MLRSWLLDHVTKPYPTEIEKAHLASLINLERAQINNWFINARVRLWKPLVERVFNEHRDTSGKHLEVSLAVCSGGRVCV